MTTACIQFCSLRGADHQRKQRRVIVGVLMWWPSARGWDRERGSAPQHAQPATPAQAAQVVLHSISILLPLLV